MKKICSFLAVVSAFAFDACSLLQAATTIDPANRYAYGENIGWVDAYGDPASGAVIGEYVCSGYLYGANVGWINLGNGAPANGVQYQNDSANDFGVNLDHSGSLHGLAWGANIGWINFEPNGTPRVDIQSGQFSGYAYSANCGWLSLSNAFASVRTTTIVPSYPPLGPTPDTWIGGSGDWNDPANWSTGKTPGPADDVLIAPPDVNVKITISSGSITVKGMRCKQPLILSGGTLSVTNVLVLENTFTLSGGTLLNTRVVQGTNSPGIKCTDHGGVLNRVRLDADLDLTAAGETFARVVNGLVLNGTARVGGPDGWYNRLEFSGSQTLDGIGRVILGGGRNPALKIVTDDTTLTLGPSLTVSMPSTGSGSGYLGMVWDASNALNPGITNQGTILADQAGSGLAIRVHRFVNQGKVLAQNGSTADVADVAPWFSNPFLLNQGLMAAIANGTLTLGMTWTNRGILGATNGTLNLRGQFATANLGTLNRSGGTVKLTGTLENTGATLRLDPSSGPWVLDLGHVHGGTIQTTGGVKFVVQQGTFEGGVEVDGELDLTLPSANLQVKDGLILNGTATIGSDQGWYNHLEFAGTQTLGGEATLLIGGGRTPGVQLTDDGTTLTLGPKVVVRDSTPGAWGFIGLVPDIGGGADTRVINLGTIAAGRQGGNLQITAPRLSNRGQLEAGDGGTLRITSASVDNTGNASVLAGGVLEIQNSWRYDDPNWLASQAGGTVRLTGNLLGGTRNASEYLPSGALVLNGAGTGSAPQLLEVMSEDLGSRSIGFVSNYAYGNVALGGSTYVKLVDQFDNGGGTNREALYVNTLSVPNGTTLDLNGLHVYTRQSQVAGRVLNGAIVPVTGGDDRPHLALGVDAQAGQLKFEWAGTGPGFRIEETASLGPATSWTPVNVEPVVSGDSYSVALPFAGTNRFYRLKAQSP